MREATNKLPQVCARPERESVSRERPVSSSRLRDATETVRRSDLRAARFARFTRYASRATISNG